MAISVVAALLPVLVFLAVLLLMDSFKLVRFGAIGAALLAGAGAAALAALNRRWLVVCAALVAALWPAEHAVRGSLVEALEYE